MTGSVHSTTTHFKFKKINFNVAPWHDLEWSNWAAVDALLFSYMNVSNVQGVWANSTAYIAGQRVIDDVQGRIYECAVSHTSSATGTFEDERTAQPTYWFNMGIMPRFRGDWVTGTIYSSNDYIVNGHVFACCYEDHTSGVFADDLAAGKWVVVADLTTSVNTATAAATAAAASATAAFSSASAAATSAADADADRVTVAADKAIVAADKATVASDKATVAADKATTEGYKTAAETAATSAAASAVTATTKAGEASTSATEASNSATSASNSATAADASKVATQALVDNALQFWAGNSTGDAYAYNVTISTTLTDYVPGMTIRFVAHSINGGAATLNVNGWGAKAMKRNTNVDLYGNDIIVGATLIATYDGTNFQVTNLRTGLSTEGSDAMTGPLRIRDQGTPTTPTVAGEVAVWAAGRKLYRVSDDGIVRTIGGGPSLGTDSIIRTNGNTINENIFFPPNTNGMSAGPITIADGVDVVIADTSNWSIV